MSKVCDNCGKELDTSSCCCKYCGHVVNNNTDISNIVNNQNNVGYKFCRFCGTRLPITYKFCNSCGKNTDNKTDNNKMSIIAGIILSSLLTISIFLPNSYFCKFIKGYFLLAIFSFCISLYNLIKIDKGMRKLFSIFTIISFILTVLSFVAILFRGTDCAFNSFLSFMRGCE